jgi:hypothetical protein
MKGEDNDSYYCQIYIRIMCGMLVMCTFRNYMRRAMERIQAIVQMVCMIDCKAENKELE